MMFIYAICYVTYSEKIQVNCRTLFLVSGLLSQFILPITNLIILLFLSVISIFRMLCFGCVPLLFFRFKQVFKYDQMHKPLRSTKNRKRVPMFQYAYCGQLQHLLRTIAGSPEPEYKVHPNRGTLRPPIAPATGRSGRSGIKAPISQKTVAWTESSETETCYGNL